MDLRIKFIVSHQRAHYCGGRCCYNGEDEVAEASVIVL